MITVQILVALKLVSLPSTIYAKTETSPDIFKNYFTDVQLKSEIRKAVHQHRAIIPDIKRISEAKDEEFVQNLFATIRSTYQGYDLFVQDILIRRQTTLNFGERCFLPKQAVVDYTNRIFPSIQKLLTDDIVHWQQAVLRSDYPICDYRQNLECNQNTKKCDCKVGRMPVDLNRYPPIDGCKLLVGQNCESDYDDGTYYYDPIENFYNWTKSKSPACITNSTCRRDQYFFSRKCWCEHGKTCENSMGMLDKEIKMILDRNLVISDNFILNMGDKCDPNFQKDLLNPPELSRRKTEDRLNLLHTLSDYDVAFCNVKMLLNCTESTKTCDCWEPLTLENGQCRIKNKLPCGKSFLKETQFYPDGLNTEEIGHMLQFRFQPSCIESTSCQRITENFHICACKDITKGGEFCNETKSVSMLKLFGQRNNWPLSLDNSHNNLFHELNRHLRKLDEKMSLAYDEYCYEKNSPHFVDLMTFLFTSYHQIIHEKNESQNIEKLLNWTRILYHTNVPFCMGFEGLYCPLGELRCRCLDGFHWDAAVYECSIDSGVTCDTKSLTSPMWEFKCNSRAFCNDTTKLCQCSSEFQGTQCNEVISPTHHKPITKPVERIWSENPRKLPPSTKRPPEPRKVPAPKTPKNVINAPWRHSPDFGRIPAEDTLEDVWEENFNEVQENVLRPDRDNNNNNKNDNNENKNNDAPKTDDPPLIPCPEFDGSRGVAYPALDFDQLDESILKRMTLGLNDTCDPSYDIYYLYQYYFDPVFYSPAELNSHFDQLKVNVKQTTGPLCNGFLYLSCDKDLERCKCDVYFDLVEQDDGRCYIDTNDLCGNVTTKGVAVGKKRDPPRCREGHICDRFRFNLFKCRPLLTIEVNHFSGGMRSSWYDSVILWLGMIVVPVFCMY